MKYIGKFFKGIIIALMLMIIVVGVCVIFGVKNVNINLVGYSFTDSEKAEEIIYEYKSKISEKCSGSLMAFVGEGEIREIVDDNSYTLVSFEKYYPCTLNITIRERREAFAVLKEDESHVAYYEVYDDGGVYIRHANTLEESYNAVDSNPNITLTGVLTSEDITLSATCANYFEDNFGGLRSVVKEIIFDTNAQISDYIDRLTFVLTSGYTIEIRNFKSNAEAKIIAAVNYYKAADPATLLEGGIFSFETELGAIVVVEN